MSMTSKQVRVYARKISKKLSTDDFTLWFEFTHIDGTEMFFNDCLYEEIEENIDDLNSKKWMIIWTKNHGAFIYPTDELEEWDGGDNEELDYSTNYLVLPV